MNNVTSDGAVLCGMKDAAVQQYGSLPWRVSRKGIMKVLLVTSRRCGRWMLPKGWQIKDCSPVTSAAREAFEEAGVIGPPGSEPIGSYRYVRLNDDGSVEPRNVTVFDVLVRGTLLTWLSAPAPTRVPPRLRRGSRAKLHVNH
jgi:8-oxo-dGTP pyrophosphatase MutT (NUDIX family)